MYYKLNKINISLTNIINKPLVNNDNMETEFDLLIINNYKTTHNIYISVLDAAYDQTYSNYVLKRTAAPETVIDDIERAKMSEDFLDRISKITGIKLQRLFIKFLFYNDESAYIRDCLRIFHTKLYKSALYNRSMNVDTLK